MAKEKLEPMRVEQERAAQEPPKERTLEQAKELAPKKRDQGRDRGDVER